MSKVATNLDRFLKAANWALKKERDGVDVGINIRRLVTCDGYNVAQFNVSKGLMYEGYSHKNQQILKGLIVREENGQAVDVLAACLPKFYNLGEPDEKKSHMKFLKRKGVNILFTKKEDGVNIRPWWDEGFGVQFATRSMPMGVAMGGSDEDGNLDFGWMAREIATEKYRAILSKELNEEYSLVFEMIHPDSRIVTDYGDRKDLILLAAFDKSRGFAELSYNKLFNLAMEYDLKLVEYWLPAMPNTQFDEGVDKLQALWDNSDHEGTVATFIRSAHEPLAGEPLYRLKIKNSYYLQLLRLMKFCTLKNLREMIETNNLLTWEEIRAKLYETPSMSEELEMAYKDHYQTYINWLAVLACEQGNILREYMHLPKFETRKDFALAIADHAYRPFFFAMKDFETRGGDIVKFWKSDNKKMHDLLEKMLPLGSENDEEAA